MAVLITGATGFLGRHLLQALSQDPDLSDVVVLVRHRKEWDSYDWARDLPQVTVIEGSITDASAWGDHPALRNLRGIFHLAAVVKHNRRHVDEVYRVNVQGARTMVQLGAKYGCRVVLVSTSGTVGCFKDAKSTADERAPHCEDEVGSWPYYGSKIQAERQATQLAEELGVELVIVRPPVLLGPGDHRFRSTGHVIRFLRRRLPFLIRGGIHYVDIRDAAQALVSAMKRPNPRPVYHLYGTSCSIDEFFQQLQEVSGVSPPKLHLPYRIAWTLSKADEWIGVRLKGEPLALLPDPVVIEMAARYWDVRSLYAKDDLGFEPRAGRETLADTVTWLREHRKDLA